MTRAAGPHADTGDTGARTFTAWVFDTADGADLAVRRLLDGPTRAREAVEDGATASWEEDAPRPRIQRRPELTSDAALGGEFWDLVLGLTFRVPLLGAAVAGVAGAASGSLADAGIDEGFMNRLRDTLTPGRSALLVLGSEVAGAALAVDVSTGPERPDVVAAHLSPRQVAALREVFLP
ncbi:MAG: DUF1269 domain-containing protein [Nocardioidaceae bacterium]|nr:DUF1269 domain-containing protein [Nocardioidaceae bacterium]NUS51419.1 DUF1269 domain-containing protein [Nocardioidaceae bacterium]